MGEIRITDDSGEERIVTGSVNERIELRIENGQTRVVIPEDSQLTPDDIDVVEEELAVDYSMLQSPWWFLFAPTLLGTVLLIGTSLDLFGRVAPTYGPTLSAAAGLLFVVSAGTGTYFLVADARALQVEGSAWQPTALPYVAGGGVVSTAILLASAAPLPATADSLVVVAGASIVGMATASAVSGPLYLYRRYRRIGLS